MDAARHTSPLILSFSTLLFTLQASGLTSTTPGSLGIACNFTSFPVTGCEDTTLYCERKTDECLCQPDFLPAIGLSGSNRCIIPPKNLLEPCTSSRECEKISGKCIHPRIGEIGAGDSVVNPSTLSPASGLTPSNLLTGMCQCSEGTFYSSDKKKCLRRIIGSHCANSTDCYSRQNVQCSRILGKCLCMDGFIPDENTDQCRTLAAAVINPSVVGGQRSQLDPSLGPKATPLCDYGFMYDHAFKRCIPLMHWDHQRTWSALVWKIMVLCIVLLLLMVLASGLQRARQNANMINWSRALELYAARESANNGTRSAQAILASLGAASRPDGIMVMMPPPPPQYSQADTRRNVHLNITTSPRDDPPSYEEAIRIAPTSPSVVTTGVSENSTDQGSK